MPADQKKSTKICPQNPIFGAPAARSFSLYYHNYHSTVVTDLPEVVAGTGWLLIIELVPNEFYYNLCKITQKITHLGLISRLYHAASCSSSTWFAANFFLIFRSVPKNDLNNSREQIITFKEKIRQTK